MKIKKQIISLIMVIALVLSQMVPVFATENAVSNIDEVETFSNAVVAKPLKPSNVSATAISLDTIQVKWDLVSGATGYEVYRFVNGKSVFYKDFDASTTEFDNSGKKAGVTYYYKIRSYKTVSGEKLYSGYTDLITCTVPKEISKPLKPSNVSATAISTDTIQVKWDKVSDATGYEVYRFVNGKSVFYKAFDADTTIFDNGGKKPGITYYYKIRSYKTFGGEKIYSGYTDLITCTVPTEVTATKPLKPSNVSATAISSDTIKVQWDKVSGATGYEVYRFVNGKSVFYKAFDADTTEFDNSGKKPGVTYYYKIRSYKTFYGKKLYSGYTDLITCTVPKEEVKAPSTPTNAKATALSQTQVKVSWNSVSGATGYEVYKVTGSTSSLVKSLTTTSYTESGKTAGTSYSYKVRAYKTVDGKKVYSDFTSTLTCTTQEYVDNSKYGVESKLGYQTLTASEKTVYKEVLDCLMTKSAETQTSTSSSSTLAKVWEVVLSDYATIFWSNKYSYSQYPGKNITFINTMSFDKLKIASMQSELDTVVNRFVTNFYKTHSKDASDYEIAKAVYEYVINNTTYSVTLHNQLAYGSLVDGSCVCAGYTRAVQVLLAEFDIPSFYVTGYSHGESHAWNLVKLDGNFYYIDATWGDLNNNIPNVSDVTYDYFCLTTKEMEENDHDFRSIIPLPECTKTNYNYYIYNGFYTEKYNYNKVLEVFTKQYKMGHDLVIKFGSSEEENKAVSDLLTTNHKVWELLDKVVGGTFNGKLNYYNNPHSHTLTLTLS